MVSGSAQQASTWVGGTQKNDTRTSLTAHFGSRKGGHGDRTLCFQSKMIRIIARSLGVTIPLGQRCRAHVPSAGSIWFINLPTILVSGGKVAVVVDEGALQDSAGLGTGLRFRPCLPGCTDSDARTQPFTMPMLTPTEKSQTMSGWRKRISVAVLIMVCRFVRRIARIRRIPRSGHIDEFLIWEGTQGPFFLPSGHRRRIAT